MQWWNRHIQFDIRYGKTEWQLWMKVAQCKTQCEMEKSESRKANDIAVKARGCR